MTQNISGGKKRAFLYSTLCASVCDQRIVLCCYFLQLIVTQFGMLVDDWCVQMINHFYFPAII